MRPLKYIVLALALGCGGNSSDNDRDSSNPYQDLNSMYDSSSGRNNKKDSGRHPYDSGLEGRLDAGIDSGRDMDVWGDGGETDGDAGNGTNRAPSLRMVYEESHPLAGETYTERNVRRMRDTPFVAEVSDPDGDDVESQFEFSDGYTRGWDYDPAVIHAFGSAGDYSLTARVRDSRGLEGETRTIGLRVMNNIPPVANAGPDIEGLEPSTPYCIVFGPCPSANESGCGGAPYAPGHSAEGTGSFDEDGDISSYEIFPDYVNFPESRYNNACAGLAYSSPGERTLRLRVTDNEGAQDHDDTVINVE